MMGYAVLIQCEDLLLNFENLKLVMVWVDLCDCSLREW